MCQQDFFLCLEYYVIKVFHIYHLTKHILGMHYVVSFVIES